MLRISFVLERLCFSFFLFQCDASFFIWICFWWEQVSDLLLSAFLVHNCLKSFYGALCIESVLCILLAWEFLGIVIHYWLVGTGVFGIMIEAIWLYIDNAHTDVPSVHLYTVIYSFPHWQWGNVSNDERYFWSWVYDYNSVVGHRSPAAPVTLCSTKYYISHIAVIYTEAASESRANGIPVLSPCYRGRGASVEF